METVTQQTCLPFPPGTYLTLDKAGPLEAPGAPNLIESESDTFLWGQSKVWRVGEESGHAWRPAWRRGVSAGPSLGLKVIIQRQGLAHPLPQPKILGHCRCFT